MSSRVRLVDQGSPRLADAGLGAELTPPPGERWHPYVIPTSLTVNGGSQGTTSPSVQVGSFDFICTDINFYSATQAFTVLIQDQGTSHAFMPSEVHYFTLIRADREPWRLRVPYRFQGNGAIYLSATNLASSGSDTLYVTLIGYRVLPPP